MVVMYNAIQKQIASKITHSRLNRILGSFMIYTIEIDNFHVKNNELYIKFIAPEIPQRKNLTYLSREEKEIDEKNRSQGHPKPNGGLCIQHFQFIPAS